MLERLDLTGSVVDLTESVAVLTGSLADLTGSAADLSGRLAEVVHCLEQTLVLDRDRPDIPPHDHRNKRCD